MTSVFSENDLFSCKSNRKKVSARILVEFAQAGDKTVVLTPVNTTGVPTVTASGIVEARRPYLFKFENVLRPNVRYSVLTRNTNSNTAFVLPISASLKTLGAASGSASLPPLRYAAVSCNKAIILKKEQAPKDLWRDIAARAKAGALDMLLHMGDQIYMDSFGYEIENGAREIASNPEMKEPSSHHVAKNILRQVPENEWSCGQVQETYRQVYRDTWANTDLSVREALANVPNLMILNDHELQDDLGLIGRDIGNSENRIQQFALRCSYLVYLEYQHQLVADIGRFRLQKTGFLEDLVFKESCKTDY